MGIIWLKDSLTGEVKGIKNEKEARRLLFVGGSVPSTWKRIMGRKDSSLYVEPKKKTKKNSKKGSKKK